MFRFAVSFAIALALTACESVPEVTFGDGDSIDGSGNVVDATSGNDATSGSAGDGADPGPTGDDGPAPPADTGVDAPIPPIDSGADAGVVNTCPKSPPKGADACCNAVACNGQCQPSDCFHCGVCGPKMMCCTDKKLTCVPLGSPCPN